MKVPSAQPVQVSIERDHPIPFVRIDTVAAGERHSLKLEGEFRV